MSDRSLEELPRLVVEGRHTEVLGTIITVLSHVVQQVNADTARVDKLGDASQSMSGHVRTLIDELTKLQGRELYQDAGGVDIWHLENGKMYPLSDEGEHIDVRGLRHRARYVAPVLGMNRPSSFPTYEQIDRLHGPLQRVTELDVVRRHVRRLEARIVDLEG